MLKALAQSILLFLDLMNFATSKNEPLNTTLCQFTFPFATFDLESSINFAVLRHLT